MEGRLVLHFPFFNAVGGLGFYFFGFLLEERGGKICDFVTIGMGSCRWCGGVHIVGKERGEFGWVSIWRRSEVGGTRRRDERVGSSSSCVCVKVIFRRYSRGSIFPVLILFFFTFFFF